MEIHSITDGPYPSNFLTALRSRVQRQERMIRVWDLSWLTCSSLDDANAYHAIMEHCERIIWEGVSGLRATLRIPWMSGGIVRVRGDMGAEGWTALAAGLQRHPFRCFEVRRLDTRAAPREALKMIWDAMDNHDDSNWFVYELRVLDPGLSIQVTIELVDVGNVWLSILYYVSIAEWIDQGRE